MAKCRNITLRSGVIASSHHIASRVVVTHHIFSASHRIITPSRRIITPLHRISWRRVIIPSHRLIVPRITSPYYHHSTPSSHHVIKVQFTIDDTRCVIIILSYFPLSRPLCLGSFSVHACVRACVRLYMCGGHPNRCMSVGVYIRVYV